MRDSGRCVASSERSRGVAGSERKCDRSRRTAARERKRGCAILSARIRGQVRQRSLPHWECTSTAAFGVHLWAILGERISNSATAVAASPSEGNGLGQRPRLEVFVGDASAAVAALSGAKTALCKRHLGQKQRLQTSARTHNHNGMCVCVGVYMCGCVCDCV